ncbi:helix-turn-helix transcriptional regulator [Isachenkonia alkalipeptolytica]|uniref:Helix-turn-helix transcriptional regulator n=1 Tax=Isachenkonia alkalipeptolytica TaxID=2565777 RepID=A0AA43XKV5_9CLOT|nr:helix-turn-helix transcriptional regulator [Isachenkonia alkalipeptolytica]
MVIELTKRQKKIIEIVKNNEPISSEKIAEKLGVIRATLRPDLSILTMSGILDARPKVGYFYSGKSDINVFSQEAEKYLVEDVMKMPVVVTEDSTIYDAIVTLFLEDTGTIYVVANNYLSGVVSRKDFLKTLMGGGDMNKMPVGMIMTRMPNLATVTKNETIIEAANRIVENEVDSLPVVEVMEENGKERLKVIGKVSKSNITELFVNLCKK